jgi:hypothetical protein
MMKSKIILLTFLAGMICGAPVVRADPNDIKSSTKLSVTFSTLPEAKLKLTHAITVPFLQGENALTKNNNLNFEFAGELTPVSMDLLTEVSWTPIAFFQLLTGGQIGSGWNINVLNRDIRGIGINRRNVDGTISVDGSAFDGLLWNFKTGGSFQFDLAALFPGDWHHVIFRTYHETLYAAYSRATENDSWFFVFFDDDRNGWNYYGSYLVLR